MPKYCIYIFILVSTLINFTVNDSLPFNTMDSSDVSLNNIQEQVYLIENDLENIIIKYPQIIDMNNANKNALINELIKGNALKSLSFYNTETDLYSLDISYKIELYTTELISIVFSGVGYVKDGAYPNRIFYTVNIDLNKCKVLVLTDRININTSFIEELIKPNTEYDEYKNHQLNYLENLNQDDLIKWLQDTDKSSGFYSYYTKDSLGISFPIPHSIGDHVELEISYDVLESLLLW